MKLWLTKNPEVPMRQQLITQITIGIASDDLSGGEKLPSRGEIARRFDVHENTVSNAYKELAEKGLIEFRQGSGFFVCDAQIENFDSVKNIDSLALKFIQNASELGYSSQEIKKTLARHLDKKLPKEILVIETDKELREILVEEIKQTTGVKTLGISLKDFKTNFENLESVFVALSDEKEKLQTFLPGDKACVYLNAQSVPAAMSGETRPSEESLIAIASGWRTFLMMAKTILVAAKVDNDSIIVRSTVDEGWQRGLDNATMIICDSLTANKFPNDKRIRPFPLIAEESLNELAGIIQNRRQ